MKKLILCLSLVAVIFLGGCSAPVNEQNAGGVSYSRVETKTVLNAISASTTSSVIDINGADRVTLSFGLTNYYGYATSTFVVTVSADGTNYVTFNKLIDNVVNSNSQTLTRAASVIMDQDTDQNKVYSLDLEHDIYKFMKVTDTIAATTTSLVGSTATVKALINF